MRALPVLTFHSIDDRPDVLSFPPGLFERGLARLHEAGYRTLPLSEAIDYVLRARPFPARSFVITFDDGFRSVYETALPVLRRYGMCATLFMIAASREARPPPMLGRPMLSWSEVRELHAANVSIGAHTISHADLRRLPLALVAAEMSDSRTLIEDMIGAPVTSFAYPRGYFNERIEQLARERFSCACSDRLGLVTHASNPYALERVDAYYLRSESLFALILSRGFPWYVRARSIPRSLRRAFRAWREPVREPA
jgi:peptidoglycan/xylan/chitin deacetylase (PgdA/CDA1 family)